MAGMRSTIEVLSEGDILQIHDAALQLLARTGVHMPHPECLRRCERAGAEVDHAREIVRLPTALSASFMERLRAVATPPGEETPTLSGGISTQVFVSDYRTRSRRPGSMDDIMRGIALVRHLDNIPYANAVTIPAEIDARVTDLHSYLALMSYSEKPGGTYILSEATGETIMDMSELVGQRAFYLFESVSPLRFRRETLDIGLRFADRGHHLGIAPMIMGGMTAPITLAGSVTLIVAEVIASLFAVYALSGELSAFFGHGSHTNDPRTMICSFGSPNQALIGVASAQMARFYGLPSGSNSALSDALLPDFQCGFEKSLSALMSCLAGTVSIGCQGIAGADQGFSFEQLVIDNEWLDAYNYVVRGFEVDAERIALELIEEVGIGGDFMAEEHTVDHLHDSWWPSTLFAREDHDQWQRSGAPDLLARAHELVNAYTADYREQAPVLAGETVEALERLVRDAERRITSA